MDYDFITWLGHAGFLIKANGLNIFIDPFRLGEMEEKADIVFITHPHMDHLSQDDLDKITTVGTHFVIPMGVEEKIKSKNITFVKPGDRQDILGIAFEVVASYNMDRQKLNFHRRQNGWVGYVIEANGKRIYHPGDTDIIDDMAKVDVDLALLPCGGKFVMDIDEAIEAAKKIRAKNFSPMHYKALLGKEESKNLEKKFVQSIPGAIIMEEKWEPYYSL